MPGDPVLVAQDWGRWETMRRVTGAWGFLSIVGVLGSVVQLFLQLLWGSASPGPGLAVLIVVMAVSALLGVIIGYFLATRLWRRCGTTGTYRRKVLRAGHVMIVLLLVFVIQFGFRFVPLPIVVGFGVGFFSALSTTVLGIVWFEHREGCRFWYGPMPTRQKPEWIEVRAVRLPTGAAR
jgi:hypothetical protein